MHLVRSNFLQMGAAASLLAAVPLRASAQDAPTIRLALTPNDWYAEGRGGSVLLDIGAANISG